MEGNIRKGWQLYLSGQNAQKYMEHKGDSSANCDHSPEKGYMEPYIHLGRLQDLVQDHNNVKNM